MTRGRAKPSARERAGRVLDAFGVKAPPVPVKNIAESKGVSVRFVPLKDELSGMIFVQNALPVIVVNSLHPPNPISLAQK